MNYLRRQDGIAKPLIIIGAVVFVVIMGLAVWQQKQAKDAARKAAGAQTATSPSPTPAAVGHSASPTPAAATQNEIKLPELGFKMTLPEGLYDLKYVAALHQPAVDGNGPYSKASFSSTSLEQKDPGNAQCTAAKAAVGSITRYESQPRDLALTVPVKQVGNFYLVYTVAGTNCSDVTDFNDLNVTQSELLQQAYDSAVPL